MKGLNSLLGTDITSRNTEQKIREIHVTRRARKEQQNIAKRSHALGSLKTGEKQNISRTNEKIGKVSKLHSREHGKKNVNIKHP